MTLNIDVSVPRLLAGIVRMLVGKGTRKALNEQGVDFQKLYSQPYDFNLDRNFPVINREFTKHNATGPDELNSFRSVL